MNIISKLKRLFLGSPGKDASRTSEDNNAELIRNKGKKEKQYCHKAPSPYLMPEGIISPSSIEELIKNYLDGTEIFDKTLFSNIQETPPDIEHNQAPSRGRLWGKCRAPQKKQSTLKTAPVVPRPPLLERSRKDQVNLDIQILEYDCRALKQVHHDLAQDWVKKSLTDMDFSPLHLTIGQKNFPITKLILIKSWMALDKKLENFVILVNRKDSNKGCTALHEAVKVGDLNMVEVLLKVLCDPNLEDNEKNTPLHLAIWPQLSLPLVEALLRPACTPCRYINKVNTLGETPLLRAIKYIADPDQLCQVVTRLATHEPTLDLVDQEHKSVFHYLMEKGMFKLVKLLVKDKKLAKSALQMKDHKGRNLLHFLENVNVQSCRQDASNAIKAVVKLNVNLLTELDMVKDNNKVTQKKPYQRAKHLETHHILYPPHKGKECRGKDCASHPGPLI